MDEFSKSSLDAAEQAIGTGPVVMVNLLWFRSTPDYPGDFGDARRDSRRAYYDGYAGAFGAIATTLGISTQLIHVGRRLHGLLAGPDGDWDDIVVVRYERFSDLKAIIAHPDYARLADPHRRAAIADWRFFATQG